MTHTPICLGCRYYLGHPSYRIHGCRWDGLGHTFMSPIYVAHQGQTLLFFFCDDDIVFPVACRRFKGHRKIKRCDFVVVAPISAATLPPPPLGLGPLTGRGLTGQSEAR